MPGLKPIVIRPMTGGMVTALDARFIRDNEYQNIENFIFEDGLWRKRPGVNPLYDSGSGGHLSAPVIGLWRYYRSNGDKYSIAIDIDDVNTCARLLGKKNDTISSGDWETINAALQTYGDDGTPKYYFATVFGEKLIITDGQDYVRFIEEKDSSDTWIYGRVGAFRPHLQPSVLASYWNGNPIMPGGFSQYCYRYVYEDENGKRTYSNPSPRTEIYPMDWMGVGVNGFLQIPPPEVPPDEPTEYVGPTNIIIEDIGVGTEHMTSATDDSLVKRIVRRDVFRRSKRFADNGFSAWGKVGETSLLNGVGGSDFDDRDESPSLSKLESDNYPPPIAKYPLHHKDHLILFNIKEDSVEDPYDQADETYPYYQNFGLLKRATITIKNNTRRGFTDAIVRFKLQWSDANAVGYIAFDDSVADADHNFIFADSDEVTPLAFYRESYNNDGDGAGVDEAIFVVKVPEVLAGDSAIIYVYYNKAVAISDHSDWTKVYHRKYASSDMESLYNFNGDWPMEYEDDPNSDRIECKNYEIFAGFEYWNDAAFYAGGTALPGTTLEESCKGLTDLDSRVQLKSIKNNISEGTIQFWFRLNGNEALVHDTWYQIYGYDNGDGFKIRYYHSNVAADCEIRVSWIEDDGVVVHVGFNGGVAGCPNQDYSDETWRFLSFGWGTSNSHFYIREIDQSGYYDDLYTVGVLAKPINIRLSVNTGHGFGNINEESDSFVGNFDEYVAYTRCLTPEETEVNFHRRDLDAYFYDTENAGASNAWNSASATCTIVVNDLISIGDEGDSFAAGMVISDRDNPHTFMRSSRRVIGLDSDAGSGIVEFDGHVLLYKQESVHRLRTDGAVSQWRADDAPVDESGKIGLVAPLTLQKATIQGKDVVIGLSDDGLYAYFGGSTFVELSQSIRNIIRALNGDQKRSCVGAYWKDKHIYMLGISDTARSDRSDSSYTLTHGIVSGVGKFTVGEIITESTTNAQGTVIEANALTTIVTMVEGSDPFSSTGGTLTGSISLETATGSSADKDDELDPDYPSPYVPSSVYFFHLDTIVVGQNKDGESQVNIKISKATSKRSAGDFPLGYPCAWGSGENRDNGELLFGNTNEGYIYVVGERASPSVYLDKWGASDITIPVKIKPKRFWHRSAKFYGFIPYYSTQKSVDGTLTDTYNVLDVIPKTYDELTHTITTHATIADVISGGKSRRELYLFPKAAKGEWLELEFQNTGASAVEGTVVWEGLMYQIMERVGL